jgi:LmbE family N-acetylglucosaminyl deacetylase
VARSLLKGFAETLAEAGIENPIEVDENPEFGTPDELITTTVDCSEFAGRKFASLAAHASQSDNIFFLQMGEERFSTMMGTESFVRVFNRTDAPVPEDDLFAGLR